MTETNKLWISKAAIRGDKALEYLSSPDGEQFLEQVVNLYGKDHGMFAAARRPPFDATALAKMKTPQAIGYSTMESGFRNQAKRNMLATILRQRR